MTKTLLCARFFALGFAFFLQTGQDLTRGRGEGQGGRVGDPTVFCAQFRHLFGQLCANQGEGLPKVREGLTMGAADLWRAGLEGQFIHVRQLPEALQETFAQMTRHKEFARLIL